MNHDFQIHVASAIRHLCVLGRKSAICLIGQKQWGNPPILYNAARINRTNSLPCMIMIIKQNLPGKTAISPTLVQRDSDLVGLLYPQWSCIGGEDALLLLSLSAFPNWLRKEQRFEVLANPWTAGMRGLVDGGKSPCRHLLRTCFDDFSFIPMLVVIFFSSQSSCLAPLQLVQKSKIDGKETSRETLQSTDDRNWR